MSEEEVAGNAQFEPFPPGLELSDASASLQIVLIEAGPRSAQESPAPTPRQQDASPAQTPSLQTLQRGLSKRSSRILNLRESIDRSGVLRAARRSRTTLTPLVAVERCPTHGERQTVVCLEPCRRKICYECGLFGAHKGHRMMAESEFAREWAGLQQQVQGLAARVEEQERLFCEELTADQLQQRLGAGLDRLQAQLEAKGREAQEALAAELRRCQAELHKYFAEIRTSLAQRVLGKAGLDARLQEWKRAAAALLQTGGAPRDFGESVVLFQSPGAWQLVQSGQSLLVQLGAKFADTENVLGEMLAGCRVLAKPLPRDLFALRRADQFSSATDWDNLLASDCEKPRSPRESEIAPEPPRHQSASTRRSARSTPLVARGKPRGQQTPTRDLRFKTEGGEETRPYSPESQPASAIALAQPRIFTPKASHRRLPTPKDNLFCPQSPEPAEWQPCSAQAEAKAGGRSAATPKKGRSERKSATGVVPPALRAAFERGAPAAMKRLLCGRHAVAVRNLQRDRLLCLDLTDGGLHDQDLAALAPLIAAASGLRTLKLARNQLSNDGLAYLSAALANSALATLDLAGNNITADGLPFLQRLLAANRGIKAVNLKRNLVNAQAARALLAELKSRLRLFEV